MTPHRTFSRRNHAPIKERRRRRWSHTLADWGTVAGIVLDQLARQGEILPPTWRPYVLAAAAAFGLTAVMERIERRRDYERYVRRLAEDREQVNHLRRLDDQ